jgi:hypothetical protein
MTGTCLDLKIITKALIRKIATAPSAFTQPATVLPNQLTGERKNMLFVAGFESILSVPSADRCCLRVSAAKDDSSDGDKSLINIQLCNNFQRIIRFIL